MKKEYKKPELFFDSFELSSNIAATCQYNIGHDQLTCKLEDGTFTNACFYPPTEPEGACYHVFQMGFTS